MRFAVSASLLSLAASALAYQVTSPTKDEVWTTTGSKTVTWTRVDTDPANFTIVMKNQDQSYTQVLASLVNGVDGMATVREPSTGFPVGSGYQINFVRNDQSLDAILAQSPQFSVTASPASSSASGSSSTSSGTAAASVSTGTSTRTTATGSGSGSSGGTLNPTTSNSGTSPTNAPSGALPLGAQSGLVSVVAAVLGAVAYLA